MIDLLLKAIEKGIELLRERKKQKKLFFDDVVKPIHTEFEKMYQQHIGTFERTREMLMDSKSSSKQVSSFVEGRILFERGTTELLYRLTTLDWQPTRTDTLEKYFNSYISALATCLISPIQDPEPRIGYYRDLKSIIRDLGKEGRDHEVRGMAIKEIEEVVMRFQSFYAEVKAKYLKMQRHCSA